MLSTSFFSGTHQFLVKVSAPFRCNGDGGGIGLAKGHLSMWKHSRAENPGCVYIRSHDSLQLRNPQTYIFTLGKKHILDISACEKDEKETFQNLHYCHNQGLAWSCWTSCFLWDHFLYLRCTASCHSYYRHHDPPSVGKVQIMKLRHMWETWWINLKTPKTTP